MKYTVVIRQPVPESIRPELEQQLTERFGLSAEQSARLAARRAGRLMKPTTRERAELLLELLTVVGAPANLEEVPEEPAARPAEDDAVLAPTLASPSVSSTSFTGFGPGNGLGAASPFGAAADPFAPAAASADPFAAAPAETGLDAGLPDWARTGRSGAATAVRTVPVPAAPIGAAPSGTGLPAAATLPPLATAADPFAAPASAPAPAGDDWADFAGSLSTPDTEAPERASTPKGPEFMTAVTETVVSDGKPAGRRRNLAQQITLGTLLPLVLSSLLTLALLALFLPGLQRQLVQDNAGVLAASLGTNLTTGSQSLAFSQIDDIVKNSQVGFVRVELPGGTSYLRSRTPDQNDRLNTELGQWVGSHPTGGTLSLNGTSYVVSRVTVVGDEIGRPSVVPAASATDANLIRRVTVGLPSAQADRNLQRTTLLVLLSTLAGLALAAWLALRSARRIVQPITELVKVADAISLGDLTRPVRAGNNDEIGDLAQALERMRLSLEAAMDRLRRRRRS
ncbi:HAMP domain-containing protein [uncultured Deinococcus sp.]|uniref:HAMP domain-containing protein n=1 Tax=uncultured Deinococcus sp. TaxID=158789 RepID=UPI002587264C|nr:HAMP domain-containing protein [uncultured Deinococcus sp.]